jgi:hypothetical protein
MRITVRIPTEAYAYYEVEYDTLKEYKEKHPEVAKSIMDTRARIKAQRELKTNEPF